MTFLSLSQARVIDPILTTMAIGVRTQQYIMSLAFPSIYCPKRAARIINYNTKESKYLYATRRAPGGNIARVSVGYGDSKVELYQDAIEAELPQETLEESDGIVDLQLRSVAKVKEVLAHRLEADQSLLLGDFNSYPVTNRLLLSGSNQFSDPTSPIEYLFDVAKDSILKGCNELPNTIIFGGLRAYNAVKRHPYFKNQFNRSDKVNITANLIAGALEMQKWGISTATSIDPAFPSIETPMFDNKIWIGYVPTNGEAPLMTAANSNGTSLSSFNPLSGASNSQASFGYTYLRLQNQSGGQDTGLAMSAPYYIENQRTWFFQGVADRLAVTTGLSAGYLFDNVSANII